MDLAINFVNAFHILLDEILGVLLEFILDILALFSLVLVGHSVLKVLGFDDGLDLLKFFHFEWGLCKIVKRK